MCLYTTQNSNTLTPNSVKYLFIFLTVVSIFLTACNPDDELRLNSNYPNDLLNSWVHSLEEDIDVYRPHNFMEHDNIRYRQTYTFKKDNECDYLVLNPTDGHYEAHGKWEYLEVYKTIRVYDNQNKLHLRLKVIETSSDILRVEVVL